jgi:hypothetical protein
MFERMAFDDAFAFADHDPLIRVRARHRLHFPLGPADRLRFRGVTYAEVHAEASLWDMGRADAQFA